uniref:WD repeat-containing protein 55 homolog n=1 Tax=Photinus pyralis TaxID=7054 RepID=A0A1Y1LYP2_PHOPY
MATALQQQAFALDARFNAHRAPSNPNFRTLYIRRRSQLLRDTERNPESWKQYLRVRTQLLQQRYGCSLEPGTTSTALSRTVSKASIQSEVSPLTRNVQVTEGSVVPTNQAEASRAMVGGTTIAENYAFVGVHHIFDQHSEAVTMVKFANNDRSRLCCSSLDTTLSICCVDTKPPSVISVLRGHNKAVTGFDWSANNDLIASSSLDGTIKVWNVVKNVCLRTISDPTNAPLLCCLYNPINNNLLITGNGRGEVCIANVSTGLFMKNSCKIGGNILSLTSDTNGQIVWVGNDKGEIASLLCDISGNLCRTRRLTLSTSNTITSITYRAWISREAHDPMLLVNCTDSTVCLFRVIDHEGGLQLKRKFQNRHQRHFVKSIFCPIMSFRQGACIVTGSEDSCVYFLDIEKPVSRACVNTLQGHASPVLGVTFNYDESLLATCDLEGLVIVWKRAAGS